MLLCSPRAHGSSVTGIVGVGGPLSGTVSHTVGGRFIASELPSSKTISREHRARTENGVVCDTVVAIAVAKIIFGVVVVVVVWNVTGRSRVRAGPLVGRPLHASQYKVCKHRVASKRWYAHIAIRMRM